jgi:hypothetical protein
MIFRKKRDPEERPIFGTHPGDLAIILIAAIVTVGFVALLLTPRNFGAFYKALAPAPAPKPRAEPITPGVTSMQLYDAQDPKRDNEKKK